MEPTKIYLEDGQPREKVGTAKARATDNSHCVNCVKCVIKHTPFFFSPFFLACSRIKTRKVLSIQ